MTEAELLQDILMQLTQLALGMKFIMGVVAFFLIWKVISLVYKLFGGVFFGGI